MIELDARGVKRKEIAAPLTEAELKAREQNREQEEKARKIVEEQQRRDQQLLATYAIEDDIILTRDRKISDIECSDQRQSGNPEVAARIARKTSETG